MTDTPQGAWMREYERLRAEYGVACAQRAIFGPPGDIDDARAALDAHVRGLVDALEEIAGLPTAPEEGAGDAQ